MHDEKCDGDSSRDVTDRLTKVNLEAFGDLVERICTKIIEGYKQNQLEKKDGTNLIVDLKANF